MELEGPKRRDLFSLEVCFMIEEQKFNGERSILKKDQNKGFIKEEGNLACLHHLYCFTYNTT